MSIKIPFPFQKIESFFNTNDIFPFLEEFSRENSSSNQGKTGLISNYLAKKDKKESKNLKKIIPFLENKAVFLSEFENEDIDLFINLTYSNISLEDSENIEKIWFIIIYTLYEMEKVMKDFTFFSDSSDIIKKYFLFINYFFPKYYLDRAYIQDKGVLQILNKSLNNLHIKDFCRNNLDYKSKKYKRNLFLNENRKDRIYKYCKSNNSDYYPLLIFEFEVFIKNYLNLLFKRTLKAKNLNEYSLENKEQESITTIISNNEQMFFSSFLEKFNSLFNEVNLRNRIAHGLIDNYNIDDLVEFKKFFIEILRNEKEFFRNYTEAKEIILKQNKQIILEKDLNDRIKKQIESMKDYSVKYKFINIDEYIKVPSFVIPDIDKIILKKSRKASKIYESNLEFINKMTKLHKSTIYKIEEASKYFQEENNKRLNSYTYLKNVLDSLELEKNSF